MKNTTQKTHKNKKSCITENRNLNFCKTFYWEKNKEGLQIVLHEFCYAWVSNNFMKKGEPHNNNYH